MPLYLPIPGGLIDNGSLSPLPGGGVGTTLPDLESYFNASGYSMNPTNAAPKVLGTTQGPVQNSSATGNKILDQAAGIITGIITGSPGAGAAVAASDNAAASGSSFFLSPTRIGTSIVGLVLIAGGIFLLAKGPVVNIVSGAAKDLALGA